MKTETTQNIKSLPDEELLKMIHGEQRNFVLSILYDRYERKVYFKSFSMLKNASDASDLTHDIFIKIFLNIDKFKGNSAFSLWVHSISVNTCIKYINKNKRKLEFSTDEQFELSDDDDTEMINDKLLLDIKYERLEELLKQVKEEDRLLLILKYADGLSISEISKITKLKASAIKMRLMRAKEKTVSLHNQLNS